VVPFGPMKSLVCVAVLLGGCGASTALPPELLPPDDPAERTAWFLENGRRSCVLAAALGVPVRPELQPVCELLMRPSLDAGAQVTVAPSDTGTESGAATPGVGGASNWVRLVGGGGG